MKGVLPSWATQSWSAPVQAPSPSSTAKAAGLPWVQSLQSERMDCSSVGSNMEMMALILRPLIPPVVLMLLTKRLMALTCSPYSASSAKPNRPCNEFRLTTGKTTLMLVLVTPRVLVLAWLTGVGAAPATPTPAPLYEA